MATMIDPPPTDDAPEPGDTFIELRDGVPFIGTQPPKMRAAGPLDVTGQVTIDPLDVIGGFNVKELRDPHTGKWIKDPAGHWLDSALKEIDKGKMLSHNGHEVDRSSKGFNVRFYKREGGKKVLTGERKTYTHAEDAAEAMRRGRHLNDSELKHGGSHLGGAERNPPEPKVERPHAPPEPRVKQHEPRQKFDPQKHITLTKGMRVRHKDGREGTVAALQDDSGGGYVSVKWDGQRAARTNRRDLVMPISEGPKAPPAKDISGLSALPKVKGGMSPLEGHFVAEYRAQQPPNVRGFTVKDRDQMNTQRNLEFYRSVPEAARKFLAKQGVEINFGTRPITELDHLQKLAKAQPSGYKPGQTFSKVAAVVSHVFSDHTHRYSPVVAIGGGPRTYGSGSVNVSAHEAAHALDSELGHVADSAMFKDLWGKTIQNFRVDPYYHQPNGPPMQGQKEFFAEAYAAWAEGQAKHMEQEKLWRYIMSAVDASPQRYMGPYRGGKDGEVLQEMLGERFAKFFESVQATVERKLAG